MDQYGKFDLPGKHLPIYDRHDEFVKIGMAETWPTRDGIYFVGTLFYNTRQGLEHERDVRSGPLREVSVGGYVTEEGTEILDAARFAVASISLVERGALAGRSAITDVWMETVSERRDRIARMRRHTNREWVKHRKAQE